MACDEEVPSLHIQDGVGLISCDVVDDGKEALDNKALPCGGILILGKDEYP